MNNRSSLPTLEIIPSLENLKLIYNADSFAFISRFFLKYYKPPPRKFNIESVYTIATVMSEFNRKAREHFSGSSKGLIPSFVQVHCISIQYAPVMFIWY